MLIENKNVVLSKPEDSVEEIALIETSLAKTNEVLAVIKCDAPETVDPDAEVKTSLKVYTKNSSGVKTPFKLTLPVYIEVGGVKHEVRPDYKDPLDPDTLLDHLDISDIVEKNAYDVAITILPSDAETDVPNNTGALFVELVSDADTASLAVAAFISGKHF